MRVLLEVNSLALSHKLFRCLFGVLFLLAERAGLNFQRSAELLSGSPSSRTPGFPNIRLPKNGFYRINGVSRPPGIFPPSPPHPPPLRNRVWDVAMTALAGNWLRSLYS